jgi:hypothetical protein
VRCGGIKPVPRRRREGRLQLHEREEISRGWPRDLSLRAIAVQLGRAASTDQAGVSDGLCERLS